jgi:hypothetical protein
LVYGTTLHLPGEFFNSSHNEAVDHSSFLGRLRDIMHQQRPVPPQNHGCVHLMYRVHYNKLHMFKLGTMQSKVRCNDPTTAHS